MTDTFRTLCAELVEKIDYTWGDIPEDVLDLMQRTRLALAQPEPVEPMMINCRWDGPSPEPHASVGDWFEQEGSKGLLCGLRISALPFRGGAHTSPEPVRPTDEQAQKLFNTLRQEIYHTRWDGNNIVVGYEPVNPGKFLRAGIQRFAKQATWLTNEKLSELMHDFVLGGESPEDFSFDHIGYAKAVMKACGIPEPQSP